MKLLKKNSESGQALVLALILLALGSLLIVPGLSLSATSLNYHQLIEGKTLESYSADSGLEYVLTKLYNDPGGYTGTPLQESFNLNNRTVSVTAQYMGDGIYKITSRATSDNGRSTTIEAYVNLSAGAFAYTVAAKDYMTLELVTVDGTDPDRTNIHSNGNIALVGGNVLVKGNASAVGTITGITVTGMVTPNSPPVDFPGDYSQLYKVLAQEGGNYTGNMVLSGVGTRENPVIFPAKYIQGNLTIGPNSFVRLTGTVYVTGIIEVKPGSVLDGNKNILAEQSITIEGGEYVSDLIPVVISKDGNITCKSGGTGKDIINAVLYAPNGEVKLEGKAKVYGAVGGNTVSINNATVTYAAQLQGRQDLPGGELTTIAYSYK